MFGRPAGTLVKRWMLWGALLLIGALVLPIGAYWFGGQFVGPYAGPRGLASYLGAIYGDLSGGRPLAVVLVLAPLLCVGIWQLRNWCLRWLAARNDDQ